VDGQLHGIAVLGLGRAGVAQPHQLGDAVAMIDDGLAPDLGRMGGEHGHDQRLVEKGGDLLLGDAARGEAAERLGEGRAGLGRDALPVLGEVGEQREQHEAAHEGERVVEAERVEAGIDRVRRDHAAMPVDRGRSDIFDPAEQCVAAISADDVAEQLAEEPYVRILLDRGLLHRRRGLPPASGAIDRIVVAIEFARAARMEGHRLDRRVSGWSQFGQYLQYLILPDIDGDRERHARV
jgi:hypothetical protein